MRRVLVFVAFVSILIGAAPAWASEAVTEIISVELVGTTESRFEVNGRPYAGPIVFTRHADGIAMTERATIEQYLQGIAEMPFLWNEEALKAQAVAARTYLARTLLGGRRGNGLTYGYDICATNQCQVYRGVQLVDGDHGDRWRTAVDRTTDELVIYEGRPIEAVYTSMVGSRSRANQDVWASNPVPYLQPVDSPEVGIAPYAVWDFEISAAQFVEILRADGMDVGGTLEQLVVDDPPEGEGRSQITVVTTAGTDSILAPAMKGAFNRRGDELYPGSLPATLDNGTRLPEPLPSYTYTVEHIATDGRHLDALLPVEDRPTEDVIRFHGEGWGHGVGMSQWGARILADDGATHGQILAHYYGGLEPVVAPDLVPDVVEVGLITGNAEIVVTVEGPATMLVNGVPNGVLPEGEWIVRSTLAGIGVIALDGPQVIAPIDRRNWPR